MSLILVASGSRKVARPVRQSSARSWVQNPALYRDLTTTSVPWAGAGGCCCCWNWLQMAATSCWPSVSRPASTARLST